MCKGPEEGGRLDCSGWRYERKWKGNLNKALLATIKICHLALTGLAQ